MRNFIVGLLTFVVFVLLSGDSLADIYSFQGFIMVFGVTLIALAQRFSVDNDA